MFHNFIETNFTTKEVRQSQIEQRAALASELVPGEMACTICSANDLIAAEWVLRSAEELLPKELHDEFESHYIKLASQYIIVRHYNPSDFNTYSGLHEPEAVVKAKKRLDSWSNEYIQQNSETIHEIIKEYAHRPILRRLKLVSKSLMGVLSLTAKKDAVLVLETAHKDLSAIREKENDEMYFVPDNYFLTDQYWILEKNVCDLDNILSELDDLLDDVKTLKRFNAEFVREVIENIAEIIKKIIDNQVN